MRMAKMAGRYSRVLGIATLFIFLCVGSSFAEQVQLVYTSDQHYGISRKQFRSQEHVSATDVNAAMVEAINSLPSVTFPADGGVRAGEKVKWADVVISTGDIANRMEGTDPEKVTSATRCWEIFATQYVNDLKLKDRKGNVAEVLVVPGNHDATNAVGFHRSMTPEKDNGAMVAMYNRANNASLTPETFDFAKHKVYLSRNLADVRLLVVQMWPDSVTRAWLDKEIAAQPKGTPVILFTHDQPDIEAKHLINPNGDQSINGKDKFENLVSDVSSVSSTKDTPVQEMREFVAFLKKNPSIVAYFHGNENENEFYTWKGPDNNIALPTFRVDSPMKGNKSSKDETKLSFQVVSIDTDAKKLTVREALWNANPAAPQVTWGESKTITYP